MTATNPRDFSVREKLRDGTTITIRALRPDDRERLRKAFAGLLPTTVYLRTFGYRKELSDAELTRYVEVDFVGTVALAATTGTGASETIIAGARYVRLQNPEGTAEIAFTVEEDFQGLGIASRLLRHLAAIARAQGLKCFTAEVLAENAAMLAVFVRSGLSLTRRRESGVLHLALDLTVFDVDQH